MIGLLAPRRLVRRRLLLRAVRGFFLRPSFFWHALFAGIRPKGLVQGPAHEEHDYPERRRGQTDACWTASIPPPPARSRTAAKAAIAAPQASLSVTLGSLTPPADMLPSTMVPASAPATKKIQSSHLPYPLHPQTSLPRPFLPGQKR
jgi:hypothetical protein